MKKFLALTLAAVVMVSAHADGNHVDKMRPYEATGVDKDLQTLLSRWARIEGKKLVWEANGKASILDAESFNADAALHRASSFEKALLYLNMALEAAHAENPAKAPPLQACIFTDAIVIRTIKQPDCLNPL